MRGVKNQQIVEAADKLGMSRSAFARRLKTMSFEEAAKMPPMSQKQRSKMGAKVTPWRHSLQLRGSKDFERGKK
jgi:ACT domain-containing protein